MRRALRILSLKLRSLFCRSAVDQELSEELRDHLARQTQANIAAGMSAADARRVALIEIGGLTQAAESCRDARGLSTLESMIQDVRYGVRVLAKTPLFTAVAIASLALGIGANTALFTFMNALVLRSLPVRDPSHLLLLRNGREAVFSYPLYQAILARQHAFTDVLAWSNAQFVTGTPGELRPIEGAIVSGNYASILGLAPAAGRLLSPADDRPGAEPVAVVSHTAWLEQYGGAADITRRHIVLNGIPCAIVGVMPAGFHGTDPSTRPAVFIPTILEPRLHPDFRMRETKGAWWLQLIGRLRPGVTAGQAAADLRVITPGAFRDGMDPDDLAERRQRGDLSTLSAVSGSAGYTPLLQQYRKPFLLLFACVGALLAIACTNLAALLLSRGAARSREIAVRLSLGAGRGRIMRQLLTEGLLLAVAGSALGILFARAAANAPLAFLRRGEIGIGIDLTPDLRVLWFTAGCAMITTLLFAAAPAWSAVRAGLAETMKHSGVGARGPRRGFLQPALLVGEIALCVVLLAGAGLFSATLMNLYRTQTGFTTDRVLVLPLDFTQARERRASLDRLRSDLLDRVRSLAGVQATGTALITPLGGFIWQGRYTPAGGPRLSREESMLNVNFISRGYFDALLTPLLAGHDFSAADTPTSEKVAILNQVAARRFFPHGGAIGGILRNGDGAETYRVIGVAGNAHYDTLREAFPPMVYLPAGQMTTDVPSAALFVRTAGDPLGYVRAVRRIVSDIAPRASIGTPRTMAKVVDDSLATERLLAIVSVFFGAAALLLTCIGLYGVIAFAVTRRTAEIGIRLALGASGAGVLRMVLRNVLILTACGIALGVTAAISLSRLVNSFLYGVTSRDPRMLGLALAAMLASATIAALVPALRASRTDPVQALRYE